MIRKSLVLSCFLLLFPLLGMSGERSENPEFWEDRGINLADDVPLFRADGAVLAIVEVAAGSVEKWETDVHTGRFFWDQKDGKPRRISYPIPYPANYGGLPQTLLRKEDGGDGDPLDVIVLGPRLERGRIIPVKVIGIMKMIEAGERDEKIVAVPLEGALSGLVDIKDLDRRHPGVTEILALFWKNYKGSTDIEIKGFAGRAEALSRLQAAHRGWRASRGGRNILPSRN